MLIVLRPHRGGGIGNYLFQLCHAILYARSREATLLIPRPIAFRSMNARPIALDFSPGARSYDPDQIEVVGPFIHGNDTTRALEFADRYRCMQDDVAPLFDPAWPHEPVTDETLVIHVRSGDIFQPDGSNPKYGQPPLSWYEMVIDGGDHTDVVVVTQTRFAQGGPNPLLVEIKRSWPHVRIVSDDVETDFHTLRHARHLALSVSTFAIAAAMLNTRLERLHVPRYPRPPDPNLSGAFPAGVDLGFGRVDYDIGNYEAMERWRHRPEQVQLMLEHRAADITVTREFLPG